MKSLIAIAFIAATLTTFAASATFAEDAIKASACSGQLTPRGVFDCR